MRIRICSAGLVACGVLALAGTAEAKMICPMGDVDGSGNAAVAGGSGPSGSDRSSSDAPLSPAGASSTTPAPASGGTGRPAATAPAQGSPGTAVAEVPAAAVADVPATTSVPASTGASAPASIPAPVTATATPATTAPAPVALPAAAPVVDVQAQAAAERAERRAAARRAAARRAAARRAAARRAATASLRARVAYQASFEPGTGSAWVERPASPAAATREGGSGSALTLGLGLATLLGLALAAVALLRRRGSGGTPAIPVGPLHPSADGDPVEAELQEIIAEERATRALDGQVGSGTR